LTLQPTWKIRDLNTLRFNLGVSLRQVFQSLGIDPWSSLFSPNSELALTFLSGVKGHGADRFQFIIGSYDAGTLSNCRSTRRYENQAGIEMDLRSTKVSTFDSGYDHYNLWATQKLFERTDSFDDTIVP